MSTPEAQSQAVATLTPAQQIVARISEPDFHQQIALALPEHIPPARFVRVAATALLQNPSIAQAEKPSILQSLLRAAQDGLMPDGREAALVLFGSKATYMPMIAGYRKIAAEHGWTLRTGVVYDGDEFEYELGEEPHLTHRPPRPGLERGKAIAAYAVARHKDHPPEFAVFDAAEIEKVRQTSRSKDSGPWVTWWDRMAEKTVGKYLFKRLPLGEHDERVMRIIAADETPPVEAATLIYGGGQRRAIEASAPQAEEPVQQPAHEGTAGEEAAPDGAPVGHAGDPPAEAGVASPAGDHPAPAEAPAFDEEPAEGADFEQPAAASAAQRAAAEAGLVSFTGGRYGPEKQGGVGLTIAQVHERGDETYLRWAARGGWKSEPERSAVRAYVAFHFADAPEGQPA